MTARGRAAAGRAWRAQLDDELGPARRGAARAAVTAGGERGKVARDAAPLRLIVELPAGRRPGKTVTREIRHALGPDADGAAWRVGPLFPKLDGSPASLRRYLAVTGRVELSPAERPSMRAFELARQLAAALGADVEPDLATSVFEPVAPGGDQRGPAALGGRGSGRDGPMNWSLDTIRARQAWKIEKTRGAGIRIGHPDTGYTEHPELEPDALDLTLDLDLISGDDDARDPLERRLLRHESPGHGTATGSVIAGREAGELVGVAPGATLIPLRAIVSVIQVLDGDVARAVDYARTIGCDIVSMSLGGVGFTRALRTAIVAAVDSGMIVMAAAGNHVRIVTAPARYPECLAVAATNIDDKPWSGSSRGRQVDFSAPGENVWAAGVDSRKQPPARWLRDPRRGTSYAVAHAAGAAALWLTHHGRDGLRRRYGGRVQSVFLELVRQTARRPDDWDDSRYGAGIIDVEKLLEAPLPPPRAAATAARAARSAADPDDPIVALAPDLSAAQRRARLRALLGVDDAGLDAARDRFGGEIAYLLAEDEGLRAAFAASGATAAAMSATAPLDGQTLAAALRGRASPSLAAALG